MEDGPCGGNDVHAAASTCDSYLLCVGGKWRRQLCPPGLHWDNRSKRCDWAEFAMCDGNCLLDNTSYIFLQYYNCYRLTTKYTTNRQSCDYTSCYIKETKTGCRIPKLFIQNLYCTLTYGE